MLTVICSVGRLKVEGGGWLVKITSDVSKNEEVETRQRFSCVYEIEEVGVSLSARYCGVETTAVLTGSSAVALQSLLDCLPAWALCWSMPYLYSKRSVNKEQSWLVPRTATVH